MLSGHSQTELDDLFKLFDSDTGFSQTLATEIPINGGPIEDAADLPW
jgi:hypothetical protein